MGFTALSALLLLAALGPLQCSAQLPAANGPASEQASGQPGLCSATSGTATLPANVTEYAQVSAAASTHRMRFTS